MVSLDHDSSRQGGYFFANEGSTSMSPNDEEELLGNGLTTEDSPKFVPVRTAWVSILEILILLAYEALILLIPFVLIKLLYPNASSAEQQIHGLAIIVYLHAAVWFLSLVCERYLHFVHRRSMRYGYLQFYRKTQVLRRIPLYTLSAGNVAILILSVVYLDQTFNSSPNSGQIWPVTYVQIIISVEVLVAATSLLKYTGCVIQFNRKRALPDVEQEEFNASITQPAAVLPDIGYRDAGYMENLLEKQADMIHYLRLHTEHLSKKILRLTRLTHPGGGNAMSSMHAT